MFIPVIRQDSHALDFEVSSDSTILGNKTLTVSAQAYAASVYSPYYIETAYVEAEIQGVVLPDGFSGVEQLTIRMRDALDSAGSADAVWDSEVRVELRDSEDAVSVPAVFPQALYEFSVDEENVVGSAGRVVGTMNARHHDTRLGLWYHIVTDDIDLDEVCTGDSQLWTCTALPHDKFMMSLGGVLGSYDLLTKPGATLDFDTPGEPRSFEF